jgi:hypothetical protein
MSDGVDSMAEELRHRRSGGSERATAARSADAAYPPSSNTGVLVPPSPSRNRSAAKAKKL